MRVNIGKYPQHRFYHNYLYDKFGYSPTQKIDVKIDEWDTWNMDETLAHIVFPMLKQLKKKKHSYPSDLPNEEAWNEILDKIIFSFDSKLHDWEDQFHSGEQDVVWVDNQDGTSSMKKGPNDTYKIDTDGMSKYQSRINEGFILFGKYYEHLWD